MSLPMMDRPSAGCVDLLTEALGVAGSDDVAAVLVHASAPWGFRFDVTRSVALVAVTHGTCWLRQPELGARRPVRLAAGDVALVPVTWPGHGLASTPNGELTPYDTTLSGRAATVDLSSNGLSCSLIHVAYQPASPTRRLHPSLPGVLVLESETHRHRGVLDTTVRLLREELQHDHPGRRTAAHRLVDVLVLHMIRVWMAQDQPNGSHRRGAAAASAAPVDDAVALAVDRIHTETARPWTMASLAAEVGLSRAAFVRRFTVAVGIPPSSYLSSWRLATAARRLRDTTDSLVAIARGVGYSSEFTFSRAFARAYGQPPGRYRADMSRGVGS